MKDIFENWRATLHEGILEKETTLNSLKKP